MNKGIIIVDDDPETRRSVMTAITRMAGATEPCKVFANAQDALDHLQDPENAGCTWFIITDYHMAGPEGASVYTGVDLARAVRSAGIASYVLLTSGKHEPSKEDLDQVNVFERKPLQNSQYVAAYEAWKKVLSWAP